MQGARSLSACLALWLLAVGSTFGSTIVLHDGFGRLVPGHDAQILRDATGQLTLDSLLADPARNERDWQAAPPQLDFGFTDDALWLRFTLQRAANGPQHLLLEIAYPMLDEANVYQLHGKTLLRTWMLGNDRPRENQPLFHRNILVPIDFADGATDTTVYIRARADSALQVPMNLWEPAAFSAHEAMAMGGRGLSYGILLVLFAVFVFAAITARARGFGLYVVHALCLLAYQSMTDGVAGQYLAITGDWWDERGIVIAAWLILVSGTVFTSAFLDTEHRMPRLRRWLDGSVIVLLLGLAISLPMPALNILPVLFVLALIYGVAAPAIGLYAMRAHVPLAGAWTAGMLWLLIGVELSVLNQFGIVGYGLPISDAMLGGILLQAVILAWALSQHLEHARNQRRAAQQEAVARQDDELETQKRIKKQLASRVEERSGALWHAVRQLENANRQLSELSRRDGLTGVHNRRHFEERYPELVQLASRHHQPLAVMLIDADHFKQLNDRHGHATGDECLRLIARSLNHVVSRSTDLVARYGGEEFVVVLPDTNSDGALAIAESVRSEVSQLTIPGNAPELHVSVSIGLVLCTPEPGEDGTRLISEADTALYRAKHNGRNRIEASFA